MPDRYDAYISYSHRDLRFARSLQRSIETYRVPRQLRSVGKPARLSRLFRDRDELATSSDLSQAMKDALRRSDALIVVCSPDAAGSDWVNEEIRYYLQQGGQGRVFAIIARGNPPDCFPPALRYVLDAAGNPTAMETHPVAADARRGADGLRNARLKLIAGLLDVGFDELKQRDLHRLQYRMTAITVASLAVAVVTVVLSLLALEARDDAQRRRSQAEELIGFMIGDLRTQLQTLGRLDILDRVGDESMEFYASLEGDDETDNVLGSRAQALRQIGEVRMQQGRLGDAADSFQRSLQVAARLSARHPDRDDYLFEVGQAHFWRGYVDYLWSNRSSARDSFERYHEIAGALVDREPTSEAYRLELAYANSNLGTLEVEAGNVRAARGYFAAAVDINQQLLGAQPDDPSLLFDLAAGYSWLGVVAENQGDINAAMDWYVLENDIRGQLLEQGGGWDHLELAAVSHQLLGFQKFLAGSLAVALDHLNQSLAMSDQLVSHDPDNRSWRRTQSYAHLTVARIALSQNDLPAVGDHIARALEGFGGLSAADPSNVGWRRDHGTALMVQARWLLSTRGPEAAAGAIESAARLARSLPDTTATATTRWLRGAIALTQGDIAAAQGLPERAGERWARAASMLQSAADQTQEVVVRATLAEALGRGAGVDGGDELTGGLRAAGFGELTLFPAAIVHSVDNR